MAYKTGILAKDIKEGLYARRKLDGDSAIIATSDPDILKEVVAQGKRAEAICRREGMEWLIDKAYKKAGEAHGKESQADNR